MKIFYFYLKGIAIDEWHRDDPQGFAYRRGVVLMLEQASTQLQGTVTLSIKREHSEQYVWTCTHGESVKQ